MKITQTAINKVVSGVRFKVSDKFWKSIVEIGTTDYFIIRAQEAMQQRQIVTAIRLLILAEAAKNGKVPTKKTPRKRAGTQDPG